MQEMNRTQLIDHVKRLSDLYEWVNGSYDEEDVAEYSEAYERAMKLAPNDYTLMGCIRPDFYGKK